MESKTLKELQDLYAQAFDDYIFGKITLQQFEIIEKSKYTIIEGDKCDSCGDPIEEGKLSDYNLDKPLCTPCWIEKKQEGKI